MMLYMTVYVDIYDIVCFAIYDFVYFVIFGVNCSSGVLKGQSPLGLTGCPRKVIGVIMRYN